MLYTQTHRGMMSSIPWDNPVSRAYRDYRLCSIGGGTDEVMLMVIARQMGLMT